MASANVTVVCSAKPDEVLDTEVTIVGLRWVLTWALLPLPFACRVGSSLAGVARGEPHAVWLACAEAGALSGGPAVRMVISQ